MSRSTNDRKGGVDRRGFLRDAAVGMAAGASTLVAGSAPTSAGAPVAAALIVPPPTPQQIERDSGNVRPPQEVHAVRRPGSDLMVQVLRDLGIEFVAGNPGSSFEGLQESIINFGTPPNTMPEFITALHEESAVDMAAGYAKAQGKPMCALLHGTIGLKHASMAIYQAYYGGTPMLILAGRDEGAQQYHTANDMAAIVRSFTKWDALPRTLDEALLAIQRAYAEATTPPTAPTLVVLDSELQKEEAGALAVPEYSPPQFTMLDATTAREIATSLLAAANPRIVVGRLRTPDGVLRAIELAAAVGASVGTSALDGPMSFPERHPLCGPGADSNYDYSLGLEATGGQVSIVGPPVASIARARDVSGIGYGGLRTNTPERRPSQAAPRPPGGRSLDADAEASLPTIIAEVNQQMTADRRRAIAERAVKHAAANQAARVAATNTALQQRLIGWNASPVSIARVYTELWPLLMNEDWCLASPTNLSGDHHREIWDHNRPYSYLGRHGAGGMGYGIGASTGAALAARGRRRIVINIQGDGDLNYAPGSLWTAAHHKLPMLTIVHNNRAWHQEFMFVQYMTCARGRGTDRASIGTTLRDPFINYAGMAAAYGMACEGPISDPALLLPALKRGIESVKRGAPYLIDVLTQPR